MTEIVIKQFSIEHAPMLEKIERECFSEPWSRASLEYELGNSFARFFVAQVADEVVGYIGAHNVLGEVYIANVAVSESFRKKGVAFSLIRFLCEYVQKEGAEFVTLEVRRSNAPAIALYEKAGFEKVGERRGFYEKPKEDALLMTYYFKKQEK